MPICGCRLQARIRRWFAPRGELAAELCGGRLVIGLEGGYDLRALSHGADAVCRVLLGDEPAPDPLGPAPDQLSAAEVDQLLEAIRELHGLTGG